ncbi:MAG: hypothetical protein IIY87_04790 [Bacteroidales bacterium]|jgi:uncharacterized membrane protein YgaE (UPF0421/DUF939 family)|nr:hypothetical protein [Bacteroidales bacterium]
MEKSTLSKVYEWASYIVIIAATVFFFVFDKTSYMRLPLTLLGIVVALFFRNMMYRTRYKIFEEENEELKVDLRRLTNLLEVEKKKNNNN